MTASHPLILILGMHRSGTSLLGSILQSVGVEIPGDLIEADESNPNGYFEWRQIVDLQERLLVDFDRWWPSERGYLPLPEDWLNRQETAIARAQLIDFLTRQMALSRGPWAIKDPRTSRFLPLWIEIAAELGIELRVLLAVRDPSEVVTSLVRRDGPVTGMDSVRAQLLWWRHNLEPLHAAPVGLPFCVVNYEQWFTQAELQLQRILAIIPELSPSSDQLLRATARIRPENRRSLAQAAQVSLNRRVRSLYHKLLTGSRRWPSVDPPRTLLRAAQHSRLRSKNLSNPASWLECLEEWRNYPAPRHPGITLSQQTQLTVCGASLQCAFTHLWIQRLPIQSLCDCSYLSSSQSANSLQLSLDGASVGSLKLAINLELPPPERAESWLRFLHGQQIIWDPLPERVWLLRALGLPAYWLDPSAPANGWLSRPANASEVWGVDFGLPAPAPCSCLTLGLGGASWEHALAEWEFNRSEFIIHYLPEMPDADVRDPEAARHLAAWLWDAAAKADHIVTFSGNSFSTNSALQCLPGHPPRLMVQPITPAELAAELLSQPSAIAEDRSSPTIDQLFVRESAVVAQAAVVISLYNYADHITAALDSVAAQTLAPLELVVVDDASSDQGSDIVIDWLEDNAQRFARVQLLRHQVNRGLATARNTAFEACSAEWAFVLDADNLLFPAAVEACLRHAVSADPAVAVIHPWIEVVGDGTNGHDGRSLISRVSWRSDSFRNGNVIDAMAMVRRSAWAAVGGYTHIEGGWEDFDFWCKLIEAGYHGLLCSRILARYHFHPSSMTATSTVANWRSLSRCLQARHPWLDLPYAR